MKIRYTKNKYNDEERQFLKENCKGRYSSEVAAMFNERFNRNLTSEDIQKWKTHNRVTSGIDTKIKKGWVNPCPPKPIYSEMVTTNKGEKIVLIKNEEGKWEKKYLYLYKKYHGSIPKNSAIIFLDGKKENFDKDNLVCVPRDYQRMMARENLYFKDKDLNETSLMILELIEKRKGIQEGR